MTYPDLVKAEVARRYNCPVNCEVRLIPRGRSALWSVPAVVTPTEVISKPEASAPMFNHGKRAIPLAVQEEIFRLNKQGVRLSEIARRVGRSKSVVYRYLN